LEKNKKPSFSELYYKVISSGDLCSGCGACVLICPENRLTFKNLQPEQVSGNKDVCPVNIEGRCGLCAMVCPVLNWNNLSFINEKNAIGRYSLIFAGRATDPAIIERAQDGGLVSSIFKWGLISKRWSSFVGYTRDEEWRVLPLVVTEIKDLIKTCGSKYTYISIIEGLSQLHISGYSSRPFAIVGLPCHIAAIRKLQELKSRYVKGLSLCIGLFCSKAFSYKGLIMDKIVKEMEIPIVDVKKMDIKKGLFTIEMDSGQTYKIPVKELQNYSHSGCSACTDFSAEGADISVGGLGIDGWTIAVTRTEAGEKIVEAARSSGLIEICSADNFPDALHSLEKQAIRKHEQATKTAR
jgi:coenzyme F420 hydrogenase subunit beta